MSLNSWGLLRYNARNSATTHIFGENVWENWPKNRKFWHKRTKFENLLVYLQWNLTDMFIPWSYKKDMRELKILISWLVAPHGMFKIHWKSEIWTFCALQPVEKNKIFPIPASTFCRTMGWTLIPGFITNGQVDSHIFVLCENFPFSGQFLHTFSPKSVCSGRLCRVVSWQQWRI